MRVLKQALLFAVAATAISVTVSAAEGPWLDDLEQAKKLAADSNRLVLVHFWAPWCAPCMKLETTVFDEPAVFRDLALDFVLVKLNVDEHKEVAKTYGVPPIPVDVVITPAGRLVGKVISSQQPATYVSKLLGIASASGRPASGTNEVAARQTVARQAGYWPAPNKSEAPNSTAPSSAAPNSGDPPNSATSGGNRDNWPAGGQAEGVGPRYASEQPVPAGRPAPQSGPALTGPQLESPSAQGESDDDPWGPSAEAVASDEVQSTPNWTPRRSTPAAPPEDSAEKERLAAPDWRPDRGSPPAAREDVSPAAPPQVQLPLGAAPLAMRGFSPVATINSGSWVPGDPRFGATHAGRTYLFASQKEQQDFLRDHRRYAPVLDGADVVVLVETGRRREGDLAAGAVIYPKASEARRLYLFTTAESMDKFERDPESYLARLSKMSLSSPATAQPPQPPASAQRPAQRPAQPPATPETRKSKGLFGLFGSD